MAHCASPCMASEIFINVLQMKSSCYCSALGGLPPTRPDSIPWPKPGGRWAGEQLI